MPAQSMTRIEDATEKDVALILQFIRELAEYERGTDRVSATEDVLRSTLFGGQQNAQASLLTAVRILSLSRSTFSVIPHSPDYPIFIWRTYSYGQHIVAWAWVRSCSLFWPVARASAAAAAWNGQCLIGTNPR